MSEKKYICIHGHFYQPPRENAWLEEIQNQITAAPYNNWNERINYECYAPNRAARILNNEGRILKIVNNYEHISFNFGPTLLSWMEENDLPSYLEIIEADKKSVIANNGHGNAIAQIYNHVIMPLANLNDKILQVKWGIADFVYRFGRKPEGMWLSETAVDTATLEILCDEGILFTILAPRQILSVKEIDETDNWQEVDENSIDTTVPYLVHLPGGKKINIFFYNGNISQKVAFEGILNDGESFGQILIDESADLQDNSLVNIATDGESYGHHHRYGEMALAACIKKINDSTCILTNFANYLSIHPPKKEARIRENSSWSCYHGVERWRSDCGCSTGGLPEWNQQYRKPLRDALDWLRNEIYKVFHEQGNFYFKNTTEALHSYIEVILNRDHVFVNNFLERHLKNNTSGENHQKALKLLEMMRHANLMYTSCGWFFDEVSGLETTQILQYARRAITHAEAFGAELERGFRIRLELIPSNLEKYDSGLTVYEKIVLPAEIRLEQVAMHISVLSVFERMPDEITLYKFQASNKIFKRESSDPYQLVIGRSVMKSTLTWLELEYSFCVLYMGQTQIIGYLDLNEERDDFEQFIASVRILFKQGDWPMLINKLHHYFGEERFGFNNLFTDEKVNLLKLISKKNMITAVDVIRSIYNTNYEVLHAMESAGLPVAKGYTAVVSFVLNADILDELSIRGSFNFNKLTDLVIEMKKWNVVPEDPERLGLLAERQIFDQIRLYAQNKNNPIHLENIAQMLDWVTSLNLPINLWQSQNEFYNVITSAEAPLSYDFILTEVNAKMNFA